MAKFEFERPLTLSEKLSSAIQLEPFAATVTGLLIVGLLVIFVKWVWIHF